MTSDLATKRQFAHRANVDRYKGILETHLTNEERHFVERRLAEERASLEQLSCGGSHDDEPLRSRDRISSTFAMFWCAQVMRQSVNGSCA